MRSKKKFQKKGVNTLNKLSLFSKNDGRFSKKCPLSTKNAPTIDYKNISLLKNMFLRMVRLFLQKLRQSLLPSKKGWPKK